jgi:flagellar motor protein MotB
VSPRRQEDDGKKVPAWMISFSDMVTLLLAFFVLLQSMAHERRPELFYRGQGAFREAVASFGIPYLIGGKRRSPEREHKNPKYLAEEDPNDWTKRRIHDAEDEEIREVFEQIRKQIHTEATEFKERTLTVRPTGIRFEPGTVEVRPGVSQELSAIVSTWKQTLTPKEITIYVVGLAPDVSDGPRRWKASALRAKVVEAELRKLLASQLHSGQWKTSSLGAGASSHWCRQFDLDSNRVHIVLAVMGDE